MHNIIIIIQNTYVHSMYVLCSSPGVLTILQGGGAVLLIPQYFMVVSYIVGFILGLLQIYMKKRRWIDGVVSFLVKLPIIYTYTCYWYT